MPELDAWDGVKVLAAQPCEHYPPGSARDCLRDRARALDPESDCSLAFRIEATDAGYPCLCCQARIAIGAETEASGADLEAPGGGGAASDERGQR